jgi:hypothetical protein
MWSLTTRSSSWSRRTSSRRSLFRTFSDKHRCSESTSLESEFYRIHSFYKQESKLSSSLDRDCKRNYWSPSWSQCAFAELSGHPWIPKRSKSATSARPFSTRSAWDSTRISAATSAKLNCPESLCIGIWSLLRKRLTYSNKNLKCKTHLHKRGRRLIKTKASLMSRLKSKRKFTLL